MTKYVPFVHIRTTVKEILNPYQLVFFYFYTLLDQTCFLVELLKALNLIIFLPDHSFQKLEPKVVDKFLIFFLLVLFSDRETEDAPGVSIDPITFP